MRINLPFHKTILPVFCFWVLVLFLGFSTQVQATHIRAGEITAQSDTTLPVANRNPLRYFFKMVQYADVNSAADNPTAILSFGDGTSQEVERADHRKITPDTWRNVYYFEHTYSGPGTFRLVYYEVNRSKNVVNMTQSDQQDFVLTTFITIDVFEPINHTPQLLVPPIDVATSGQLYVHNPGAFDADGDSLAFRLYPSQQNLTDDRDNPIIQDVFGFQWPNNFGGTALPNPPGGPPTFSINAVTGQITWNTPGRLGDYNVAFFVEEWRDGRKIGEVLRDMQIRVLPTDNQPPRLSEKELCVIAGTAIQEAVTVTDPDPGNIITIQAYSGILPPATFRQLNNNNGQFNWQTQCEDVREKPYQVVFRAVDNAAVPLADIKPWNIRVIGPSPTGFTAAIEGGGIRLNWDSYQCQGAEKLYIYRKEGESDFVPQICETGVPASTGFVRIGEVNKDQVTFYDNGIAGGLKRGQTYCYTIYAAWLAPGNGESLAAVPACVILPDNVPMLTNVSVTETSTTTGKNLVKWTRPRDGVTGLTPPLQYRLSRVEGQVGPVAAFAQIYQSGNLNDTTFTDTNLNTEEKAYTYKIELFHSPGGTAALVDTASPGSSVRLTTASENKAITLNWTYRVPWNNTARKHLIYRQIGNAFILIDSVDATINGGTYVDRGTYNNQPLVENQEYCYYVTTKGRYSNPRIPYLLLNNSQISCTSFEDVTAPCPPVLSINELICEQLTAQTPIQNVLTWVPNVTPPCGSDIAYYTIYYKASPESEYDSIATTPANVTTYTHGNLTSFAGCYVVTATDAAGNESEVSNEGCKDNCFYFSLPNIFTPNGDNKNDVFRPDDKRPSFIKSTKFTVFNRWGGKLYESTSDPMINWRGVDNGGSRVPDGVYYYQAEVEFFTLDPKNTRKTYKGWVEIVR
ncbi:gliding motility-associated C-terminal domain-containing protein [Adhaeribacter swui]|uniref:Gliding motility-associated C-terminal domain-containing protein n=1 Tax=Adhaeribacter swui TaxID=2086471 RepID=A0A7G7G2Q2_9BACT|nr:gliding motility-associated C-terminal domain-containing protein [Adhaeribacter swui]QNF31436.1 gliding motility-associated C-terminal domain-containing protein [Adhaeribacter swui]